MKILIDFDGVVTDLTEEAHRVYQLFESYLIELCGEEKTHQCLTICNESLRESPHLYGWRSNGRVTAYANEDGFIYVNGLAVYLDERVETDQDLPSELMGALRKVGVESFTKLANLSYQKMSDETAKNSHKPMDVGSGATMKSLLDKGHAIVVVSNSGIDRIRNILFKSEVADYLDRKESPLRIRGNARKFELGASLQTLQIGPYTVSIDRPSYRTILFEENPDVLIGDVFSLDLALPVSLSLSGSFRNTRILLRNRPYTPQWSLNFMGEMMKEVKCGILQRFDELLALP